MHLGHFVVPLFLKSVCTANAFVAFTNILCEQSSKVNEDGVHLKQNGDSVNLKQNGESVHWEANKANDFFSIVKTLLLKHSDRNYPKVFFEMKCSQCFDKQDF